MSVFNIHRDQGYDNVVPWRSSPVPSHTYGSVPESDQRSLAYLGSTGFNGTTWKPSPAGGISSTPESNQSVHMYFLVDQRKREDSDVLLEELTFSVNFSKVSGRSSSAATHFKGLSALNRWLRSDDPLAMEIGACASHTKLSETIVFIGSLVTPPKRSTYASTERAAKHTETYIRKGRARLQDIWAYQSEDQHGMKFGERLSLLYVRRTKKMPRVFDRDHQPLEEQRRFYWCVEPMAHSGDAPHPYSYQSDVESADGGAFKGCFISLGTFIRDLTQQISGTSKFQHLADQYLHGDNVITQRESYGLMRSIEIQMRH